ncbi:MAG: hypothetical protein ACLGHQ_13430, partial [Acidimicrobiia bacterium]
MSGPDERPQQPEMRPEIDDEPRVTIEMGGPNVVIRSSPAIDREYTTSLAHAVNAAATTNTVVVLDPDPIRCDDSFAGAELPVWETTCPEHADCRASEVEVVGSGTIRIAAESSWWTIDVANGRICRTDGRIDPHFIDAPSWTPVVAVCVTPTRLRALTADGSLVSS